MKATTNPHGTEAIAERLKLLRASLGMGQSEFAARVGIHQSIYNVYESARRSPSLNDARKLKQRLGVSQDWLYYGEEVAMPERLIIELRRVEASQSRDSEQA
jgi:transcriptional regulator with XRE-family HTH domain